MLGLFPALFDSERQTTADQISGSNIGSLEYMKALAHYLPSLPMGLFVQESALLHARQDAAAFARSNPGRTADMQVIGMSALPAIMQNTRFLAFHDMTGPFLHRQAYVRARFAPEPFPVTTLTHGLSYNFALWDMVTRMVLAPTLPCDSVICTSRAAREAFANLLSRVVESLHGLEACKIIPKFRLDLIPLGIDTELYRPRNPADCRELLGLPQNKTIVLYFGRISAGAKTDLHPLLLTFSALARKYGDNLLLLLAGNTDQGIIDRLNRVAAQIGCSAQVLIRKQPGIIEGPLYYGAADIFISPVETLQESFGITLLEAMASGLPVVASDWSGYRDTVVHGQTGFLIPTRWTDCTNDVSLLSPLYDWQHDHLLLGQSVAIDTVELYNSLDQLIGNLDLRCKFGKAAREHVLANFHWQSVIERVHTLWKELRQIADTLPHQRETAPSLIQSNYYQDFRHYATESIDPTTLLQLTEDGNGAAKEFPQYLLHADVQPPFNPAILQVVLRFVKDGRIFRHSVTFEEVVARVVVKYRVSHETARRHVMLLIKYGFLKV